MWGPFWWKLWIPASSLFGHWVGIGYQIWKEYKSVIELQNLLNICRCLFPLCQWWRLCLWEEKWIFYQHPKSRRRCNWVIFAEEAGVIVYNISGCSEMFVWIWPITWGNTGSEGFSTFSFHTHLQIISASIHVSIKQDFHQANKYFFQESIPMSRCKCNKWQFRFYSWNVTLKYLK